MRTTAGGRYRVAGHRVGRAQEDRADAVRHTAAGRDGIAVRAGCRRGDAGKLAIKGRAVARVQLGQAEERSIGAGAAEARIAGNDRQRLDRRDHRRVIIAGANDRTIHRFDHERAIRCDRARAHYRFNSPVIDGHPIGEVTRVEHVHADRIVSRGVDWADHRGFATAADIVGDDVLRIVGDLGLGNGHGAGNLVHRVAVRFDSHQPDRIGIARATRNGCAVARPKECAVLLGDADRVGI